MVMRLQASRSSGALTVSFAAVFTAFVAAATMIFSIYVPVTRGYFNIGETMVYTTALLFGPLIGATAGGIGSMIADLLLGYSFYAPGTLVIKAIEGAIVGYLGRRLYRTKTNVDWKFVSVFVAFAVAAMVIAIGSRYYSGTTEVSIGFPGATQMTLVLEVPLAFWILIAALIFVLIASIGFSRDPQFSLLVLAVLAGGSEMVLGYFLYEAAALSLGWAALAEVPFNVGQVMVGLLVSIPLVRAVRKRIPSLQG